MNKNSFLQLECQLVCRRNERISKSPVIKHYSHSQLSVIRKVYLHSLKVNHQKILFNYKKKSNKFTVENLASTTLTK